MSELKKSVDLNNLILDDFATRFNKENGKKCILTNLNEDLERRITDIERIKKEKIENIYNTFLEFRGMPEIK